MLLQFLNDAYIILLTDLMLQDHFPVFAITGGCRAGNYFTVNNPGIPFPIYLHFPVIQFQNPLGFKKVKVIEPDPVLMMGIQPLRFIFQVISKMAKKPVPLLLAVKIPELIKGISRIGNYVSFAAGCYQAFESRNGKVIMKVIQKTKNAESVNPVQHLYP